MDEVSLLDRRAALVARAEGYLSTEPSFARFLRAVAEATDPEDLGTRGLDELEAVFRRSYGRLGKRELASHNIYVDPPAHPGEPETVEVFCADMPFIVDSVLAAIRARGGVIRSLSHPILKFDPATYRVLEAPGPGSRLESFLHVEIDPLPGLVEREALQGEIDDTLTDVGRAVAGWRPMLARVRRAMTDWHTHAPKAPPAQVAEAIHFLGWLAEHNFTFLGMREYRLEGTGADARLIPVLDSELGVLEDKSVLFLRAGASYVEMTPQHFAFLEEASPIMVTKANIRSRVHRRSYMDYVGVKLYDEGGNTSGELRIVGLFTSMSLGTPTTEVPLIRKKISEVMKRSGHDPRGHAGKALMNALDTFPRDELFQIDEDQLYAFATAIANLVDRPRVRVLSRVDRFDNFVSLLVFVPRDHYDSDVRARIGNWLAEVFEGRLSAYYPSFPEGELVRIHFIIGRNGGVTPRPSQEDLEQGVAERIRTFADRLVAAAPDAADIADFIDAFSADYQAVHTAAESLEDIAVIRLLPDERAIALRLGAREGRPGSMGLKVYHRGSPIALSDRVPMLENFGFRVIDEDTFTVTPRHGAETYLHEMLLETDHTIELDDRARGAEIERAILAVWRGEAESDALNRLTPARALGWEDVEVLRALTHYLKQVGISYSRDYLNGVMARHADVSAALVALFHAENDPHFPADRKAATAAARATIAAAIEATSSLDEDRILRCYLNLIEAVVRTNAYQRDQAGMRRPALALKFDCARIDGLPEPRPYREIFVYSPRVEGLHLRFGPIARGGLRWSDRPEDFRTEVLGLVKAQQVKNAIIVPVGAKGAFVPRQMPPGADRETVLREGTSCYRIFVSTLLDVTDNLEVDAVVPPPDVLRRDGDDPYLVVAADKGTASFSDTANAIALARDFWLGDAFASGGSAGYDHKHMGITARGGWEAVKRHFRELDRDIQSSPFTVVGVGDMSGDVFGNGMLLSPELRLVAAFDHRDIFIDPDPDPATGLAERRRLFELPRSSWQDYNPELISKGGGVYSRSLKTVPLFAEARKLLGLNAEAVSPADVIRAILRAEVDLIWFGGIGTYVKGSAETDAEVGDKANDAVRVNGADIRALVVGEGANLGVTQLGRVEYALKGGRINTDAIDNSAGVNSSDLEVNIKIALGALTRTGQLTTQVRNEFLASMTDEVAALCLRNNYLQTLALSVEEARGLAALPEHVALIEALETTGELSRTVEFLPDNAALRHRAQSGRGLTRPELAVLLAYAKNTANEQLLATGVPDDPYLGRELYRYFPERLIETFEDTVTNHRLRREVIATVLSNAMINRGGPAFVTEMMAASSADAGQVAAAYAAARDVYDTPELNRDVDALDGKLPGREQLQLYAETQALLKRGTLWFLRNGRFEHGLRPLVDRYRDGIAELRAMIGGLLGPWLEAGVADRATRLETAGTPRELARRFAELPVLALGTDIVLVAEKAILPVREAAQAFFGVMDAFGLARVIEQGNAIVLSDKFDRMALDRALANLMRAQRDLTGDVLAEGKGDIGKRLAAWRDRHGEPITRVADAVRDLTEGEMTVSRLSVAAGLLGDLARGT
ncbi:MAG: NAD-glutamate dehydrogenase [Devosia sp.]|uniref:NAD-glutamate dehydrogenase n=1 Tax=Devosia sp. TaxID=1871048 RepID=UPI001AD04D64|nr:NAD-glutamate dehydrogenase [Devosia sp.]MBN9316596.1 NAD-glutamate dehydrogenase [Devosia sp.]